MSRAWAVYTPNGELFSVGGSELAAWWSAGMNHSIDELKADGWRCVQVEVTPVKEKADD